jgi:hypothetical protein
MCAPRSPAGPTPTTRWRSNRMPRTTSTQILLDAPPGANDFRLNRPEELLERLFGYRPWAASEVRSPKPRSVRICTEAFTPEGERFLYVGALYAVHHV